MFEKADSFMDIDALRNCCNHFNKIVQPGTLQSNAISCKWFYEVIVDIASGMQRQNLISAAKKVDTWNQNRAGERTKRRARVQSAKGSIPQLQCSYGKLFHFLQTFIRNIAINITTSNRYIFFLHRW